MAISNPTLGNYASPSSSGVDSSAALFTSLLPAIASLLPGRAGSIASVFAGIPGQYLSYKNASDQAAVDQQNKQAVISMLEGLDPSYVSRPDYPDATPSYIRQGLGDITTAKASTNRRANDMLARLGQESGVDPYALQAVEQLKAESEIESQDSLAGLLEQARNAKIANDMSIAGMEASREQYNTQQPWNKASALANAIMGYPWEVADNSGFLNSVMQSAANSRTEQYQREQLAEQKKANSRANALGWAGLGINAGTGLAGAGILAGGLNSIGSGSTGNSDFVTGSNYYVNPKYWSR